MRHTLPPLESLASCCGDPLDTTATSKRRRDQSQKYGAIFVCLCLLERWLELGVRPSDKESFEKAFQRFVLSLGQQARDSTCNPQTLELEALWNDPVLDDLPLLKELTQKTRQCLWKATMDPCYDDEHLLVQPSHIPGAGWGLFAAQDIPSQTICCYYYGNVHSIQSSQQKKSPSGMLLDASYLLRIGTISSQPWWYNTLLMGDGDDDDNSTSIIGDEEVLSDWLRKEWDQLGLQATELFVDPSTNVNIKARYINDCLQPTNYNVTFVLDPPRERAAVVTLRDICAGEELYVSYGQAYWDSLEATTGIVPRKLPADQNNDAC